MVPTFLPFSGSTHLIHDISKETGEKYDTQKMLVRSAMQLQIMGDKTDFMTVLFESVHYTLSHKVVNIAKNIGERFLDSKMDLRLSHLRLPYTLFEVCFEKGFLVPDLNVQMPSCLVVAKADAALLGAIRTLADKVGQEMRPMGISPQPAEIDERINRLLSIKYRDPFSTERAGPICHANIDTNVDDGKSVSQVIEELPTLGNNPMVSSMNDRDKLVQKKVLTVILSALCYLNTKDPDVRKYKFHDRPKLGRIPPDAVVIGERFERMPPGWHLRKAHFRMLTHERFHRDDAGQVRVRWVREAEVGKGREPAGEKAKEIDVSQRGE